MFCTNKRSAKLTRTVKPEIDKEFEKSLQRLYQYFVLFLDETQQSAALAEQRLKQAQKVLKPWPTPPKHQVDCLCKNIQSVNIFESSDDLAFLDNISKTLDNAKTLRSKEMKSSSKLVKETGEKAVRCKTSSVSDKSALSRYRSTSVRNKVSLASSKSSSTEGKSTSVTGKLTSVSAKNTSTGGNSMLTAGKFATSGSKSTSIDAERSLRNTSKANTTTNNSTIAKKTSKQASKMTVPSTLSKTSKVYTNTVSRKEFSNNDITSILLQPNVVSSQPSLSSTSNIINIIEASSSTTNTSQSTLRSTSKVNFVITNSPSESKLEAVSSINPSSISTKNSLFDTKLVPFSEPKTSKTISRTHTKSSIDTVQPCVSSLSVSKYKKTSTASTETESHFPSCPCYTPEHQQSEPSSLSLSEALSVYHIPSTLRRAMKHYQKFVQDTDKIESKSKNCDSKAEFLQLLEKRNQQSMETYTEKNPWLDKFSKYISLYGNYQRKIKKKNRENKLRYVPYTNAKELEYYLMNKSKTRNKQMWNMILKCIVDDVIPKIKVDGRDIFHLIQMLKTICKFANNSVPNVPIFRIN